MLNAIAGLALLATVIVGPCLPGKVTHYGESYQGQQLGCPDTGLYDSRNPIIIAANPSSGYACGDRILVIGPAGALVGIHVDTCPGCGPNHLDLSEAGIEIVCGGQFTCEMRHMKVDRSVIP